MPLMVVLTDGVIFQADLILMFAEMYRSSYLFPTYQADYSDIFVEFAISNITLWKDYNLQPIYQSEHSVAKNN